MKTCFKCGERKKLSEFHKHPQMADGHLNKCKVCTRRDVDANRKKKIHYYRAYDVLRAKRPDRIAATKAVTKEWRKADSRRTRAHNMVRRAIAAGHLVPRACERCPRTTDVHAHHESYDRPLDVMWLCPVCHKERHAEMAAAGESP